MTDAIKLKVLPRFPARLIGRAGIDVTKSAGDYYLDLDYNDFPVIGTVPAGTTYALIFNPATGQYAQIPISLFGGSFPEPLPDSQVYGRVNTGTGAWARAVAIAGDTMTGNLTMMKSAPTILLNKTDDTNAAVYTQKNGKYRWLLNLCDGNAESGGNVGSLFSLFACDDAGSLVTPAALTGRRDNNRLAVAGDPLNPLEIATKQYVDAHASGGTPGHIPAEPGSGSAAAGEVGQYIATTGKMPGGNITATVGTPGTINLTAHGLSPLQCLTVINSGGALPGGINLNQNYWIVAGASFTANSFQLAASMANAIAGTAIAITSAGSGTNSLTYPLLTNATALDLIAMLFPAGDWDASASSQFVSGATTSMTFLGLWLSTVSATFASNIVNNGYVSYNGAAQINYSSSIPSGLVRFSFPSPTYVYVSALSNFTVSTMAASGGMRARRPR